MRFTAEEIKFITPGVTVEQAESLKFPLNGRTDIDWSEDENGDFVSPLAREWERQLPKSGPIREGRILPKEETIPEGAIMLLDGSVLEYLGD
jgi:hypothetical protein